MFRRFLTERRDTVQNLQALVLLVLVGVGGAIVASTVGASAAVMAPVPILVVALGLLIGWVNAASP
jgi:hypothetical protein